MPELAVVELLLVVNDDDLAVLVCGHGVALEDEMTAALLGSL